jgi:hypothetical protein
MLLFRERCVNRKNWLVLGLMAVVGWCLPGCEAPIPSTPPQTSAILDLNSAWTEWQAIAAGEQAGWDVERAIELTAIMSQSPKGLTSILEFIGSETTPAQAKVLVVICLTSIREELANYGPLLTALTDDGKPSETRVFATHLLGMVGTPEAVDRAVGLLDDTDRAVRESAMGVLVAAHGERVADRLQQFWKDPDTTVAIREQIILAMESTLVERFLPLFADAILDMRMTSACRYKSATVLGQAGGPEHIAVLQQCVDSDTDPYVRDRAQGGLALLEARFGRSAPSALSGAGNE